MIDLDIYYNLKGIGDVLLIPIEEGDRYEITYEQIGDVIRITSTDGKVLGYNIMRASTYFNFPRQGKNIMTEADLNILKELFQTNGIQDDLQFDLRPKFVVGQVMKKERHDNADKLSVCQVDIGEDTLQIVCGAPNVDLGQKVVVAIVGATMPSGLRIKPTTLRGVPSNGMICSQKELELPNAPEEKGIYVLDDSYTVGNAFLF